MERKEEETKRKSETHRRKTLSSPEFVLHWPSDRRISVWYFRTDLGMRVNLNHGWNIFGRHNSSHIEIKDPAMKSTEFCVRVLGYRVPLMLYDVGGNLLVNGKRTNGAKVMLENGAGVGVIIQNVKVIYFEFRNII